MLMKSLIAAAVMFAVTGAGAAQAADIYVIRHLQKAAEGSDPPLTDEGAEQAQRLAALLEDRGIKAVFATDTLRAEQTGAPLAARLGVAVTNYDPRDPAALVEAVRAVQAPVLVVGHSNTVPALVEAFGGARPPAMSEAEYGTIFVVDGERRQVTRIELN